MCHVCSKSDLSDQPLLQCVTCERYGHAKCWELEPELFAKALTYPWQCMDDKVRWAPRCRVGARASAHPTLTCGSGDGAVAPTQMCMVCRDPGKEQLLMICDGCDRGCHTFCADPKLDRLPPGTWFCSNCSPHNKTAPMAKPKDVQP